MLRVRASILAAVFASSFVVASTAGADTTDPRAVPPPPSPCIGVMGEDGMPAVLRDGPHVIARHTLKPGQKASVGLAPTSEGRKRTLTLAVSDGFMPAFVGSKTGEHLPQATITLEPDRKTDGENTANTATAFLPATLTLRDKRVEFSADSVVEGAVEGAFVAVVTDLGRGGDCREDEHSGALKAGETRRFWLSTFGTRTFDFSEGESWSSPDQLQLSLQTYSSPNSNRKVVLGSGGRSLTPGGLKLYVTASGSQNVGAKNVGEVDLVGDAHGTLDVGAYRIEALKVVHGAESRIAFNELYAPGEPVASVLVRITRKKS